MNKDAEKQIKKEIDKYTDRLTKEENGQTHTKTGKAGNTDRDMDR